MGRVEEILQDPNAIKLHVGCGQRDFGRDWFHIDGEKRKHVDLELTGRELITLSGAPKPADLIYASHLLEYFDWQEAIALLMSWRRRLNHGGVIRLAVPDFDMLCEIYNATHNLQYIIGPLFGRMPMNGVHIHHQTAYDCTTLMKVLTEAGFKPKDIQTWAWGDDYAEQYDDYSQAYKDGRLISLNLEAEKSMP